MNVATWHITSPIIQSPCWNRSIAQIGQNAVKRKSAPARLATKMSVTVAFFRNRIMPMMTNRFPITPIAAKTVSNGLNTKLSDYATIITRFAYFPRENMVTKVHYVIKKWPQRFPNKIQCPAPYVSRSALENFPKSWKHKGHFGNIKGHLSARMPLMFPNFEKLWKHKGILET